MSRYAHADMKARPTNMDAHLRIRRCRG
jgi:hypothetical protein